MWLWVAIGVVVIYIIMAYWFSLRVESVFIKLMRERGQEIKNGILWEVIFISFFWPFFWGRLDNKEFIEKNIK